MYLVVDMDKLAQDQTRGAIQWHGESEAEALSVAAENEDLLVFGPVHAGRGGETNQPGRLANVPRAAHGDERSEQRAGALKEDYDKTD